MRTLLISDFRQVPDTQEVFVCHDDETSLVVEVLDIVTEGQAANDLFEAAKSVAAYRSLLLGSF